MVSGQRLVESILERTRGSKGISFSLIRNYDSEVANQVTIM
jgi:hypothetical protein